MKNAFERIYALLITYHDLCGHQPHSQGFFPNAEQLMGFLLQPIALHLEEALGTRMSGRASLLSFQTQQEETVFIP